MSLTVTDLGNKCPLPNKYLLFNKGPLCAVKTVLDPLSNNFLI